MSDTVYFYKDRPLFGLDIGFSSIKVMQLKPSKLGYDVLGYGLAAYDDNWLSKGVIVNFEGIAEATKKMFESSLTGEISTRRVAFSVPAAYTFSRIISLPKDIQDKDLLEAVQTETSQYLPSAIEDLYTDYSVIDAFNNERRVLTVAAPRKIIDSYMQLADILGLEVIAMEPTTGASNRLFSYTDQHNVPSVLIDFGANATDITIYDNNLVVTGTISGGGQHYTDAIKAALHVTDKEAHTIKTKFGLNRSKKQSEIKQALRPYTDQLVKEIKRMIRYYEERVNDRRKKIGQVVTLGGGSNIPGLTDHLTELLRLPVRNCDPWATIRFDHLAPPPPGEQNLYITAAGLSLINPREPLV
jgi:type IV pilus assembly protein PilM